MIIRLRTDTKVEMLTLLKDVLPSAAEGELIPTAHKYSAVMLGSLLKPTGNTLNDSKGNSYEEKEVISGYHVNILTTDTSIIAGFSSTALQVNNPLAKISGEL